MERFLLDPAVYRATAAGAEARRLLNNPVLCGTVLAVASNTVYLQSTVGEVFWLQKDGLAMHRRCIRGPFPASLLKPGQRFSVRNRCLSLGEEMTVDLTDAAKWSPKRITKGGGIPLTDLRTLIRQLRDSLPPIESPAGFGKALPVLAALSMDRPAPSFETDALLKGAIGSLAEITKGCLARDLVRVTEKGRDLVGLGQGLTPSGDDFVGALFFAARGLRTLYPEEVPWNGMVVNDLIAWAEKETNRISHTLLSDLTLGEGPEPLHDLFNAVVSGNDLKTIWTSLGNLLEIGSTSGWDMLTGFMTGLRMIESTLN